MRTICDSKSRAGEADADAGYGGDGLAGAVEAGAPALALGAPAGFAAEADPSQTLSPLPFLLHSADANDLRQSPSES